MHGFFLCTLGSASTQCLLLLIHTNVLNSLSNSLRKYFTAALAGNLYSQLVTSIYSLQFCSHIKSYLKFQILLNTYLKDKHCLLCWNFVLLYKFRAQKSHLAFFLSYCYNIPKSPFIMQFKFYFFTITVTMHCCTSESYIEQWPLISLPYPLGFQLTIYELKIAWDWTSK